MKHSNELTFIEIEDEDMVLDLQDFDNMEGMNEAIWFDDGIIVNKQNEETYRDMLEKLKKMNEDE